MSINIKRSEATQSETTETPGNHGKSWRLRSLLAMAAVAASCVLPLTLAATPAGAAAGPLLNTANLSTNPQYLGNYNYGVNFDYVTTINQYYGYASVDNLCQLYVGAQATTNKSAVGAIEIYCSSAQYVAVNLQLLYDPNGSWVLAGSQNYTNAWQYVPAGRWVVWHTTPAKCGYYYWLVAARIAIYGHGGNQYYGPTNTASWYYSNDGKFDACGV